MAEGFRDGVGGIFGLYEFVTKHGEAVEYDCLVNGYRLEEVGVSFSWRHLARLVTRWGGLAGTATFRSVQGYEGWSAEAQLLAVVADVLNVSDYHRVKIGGAKSVRRPQPLERPWDRPERFGSDAMPWDEVDAWMRSTWK